LKISVSLSLSQALAAEMFVISFAPNKIIYAVMKQL
jgi:hypothetical protein